MDPITISPTGTTYPDYADILAYLVAEYKHIYGADIYLGNDSQDFQYISLMALMLYDMGCSIVDAQNNCAPSAAQGDALSRIVGINGIRRLAASYSTVLMQLGGTAGTVISNGIIEDVLKQRWNLPATVTIGEDGDVLCTATAAVIGAIYTPLSLLPWKIITPTLGWQVALAADDAVPGDAVETDAELRLRQRLSVAIPSQSILAGITGAVANITGVTSVMAYDNDTETVDAHGIPAHTIALIVDGGDDAAVAQAIYNKKTPGVGTFGATEVIIYDDYDIPMTIRFSPPDHITIIAEITLVKLPGYNTTETAGHISAAVAAALAAEKIGSVIYRSKLFGAAYLPGGEGQTYAIQTIKIARDGGSLAESNITLDYDERPMCIAANVTVVET